MISGVFELAEIDESNWRQALTVEVRTDQVAFVADHQPVALVILAKCYLRPDGQAWTPYLGLSDGELRLARRDIGRAPLLLRARVVLVCSLRRLQGLLRLARAGRIDLRGAALVHFRVGVTRALELMAGPR